MALVQQGVDQVNDMAAGPRITGCRQGLAGLQRREQLLQDLAHVGRQHGVIGVQDWSSLLQPLQLDARVLHIHTPCELCVRCIRPAPELLNT